MIPIYILLVLIGFVGGFGVCAGTVKLQDGSRDHIRHRVIGSTLIILAGLTVWVGLRQTQHTATAVQNHLTCTQASDKTDTTALANLFGAISETLATPAEQRTPEQSERLSQAYLAYRAALSETNGNCPVGSSITR